MGRRLHYEVKNPQLSIPEQETIFKISEYYNSGKFKDVWTCENFFLDPWNFYPNWDEPNNSWEKVNAKIKELQSWGLPYREVVIKLVDEGWIKFHRENSISGFTKVGGNEYNALLVYMALIEITKQTKAVITLHDEGEFLLTPVIISNGMARIDVNEVKDSWKYWEKAGWFDTKSKDFNLYRTHTKMLMQKRLMEKYKDYCNPFALCRLVNPKDFEIHPEYGAGQIMAGFEGEYYGLTNEDSEAKSYRAIANLTKVFKDLGYKSENIVVAPKIKSS